MYQPRSTLPNSKESHGTSPLQYNFSKVVYLAKPYTLPRQEKNDPWKPFHQKIMHAVHKANLNLSINVCDAIKWIHPKHAKVKTWEERKCGYITYGWKIGWKDLTCGAFRRPRVMQYTLHKKHTRGVFLFPFLLLFVIAFISIVCLFVFFFSSFTLRIMHISCVGEGKLSHFIFFRVNFFFKNPIKNFGFFCFVYFFFCFNIV